MTVRNLSGRGLVYMSGAALLVALGISIFIASPGVGTVVVGVVPIVVGLAAIRRIPWARAGAFATALIYALVLAFVATAPLRGLTPPPGETRPPLDFATASLAVGFVVAAVLLALGDRQRRVD